MSKGSGFSPLFLAMLDVAPDRRRFLGDLHDRLHPRNWSGSLDDILIHRKAKIMELAQHADAQVRAWTTGNLSDLDRWIAHERERARVS